MHKKAYLQVCLLCLKEEQGVFYISGLQQEQILSVPADLHQHRQLKLLPRPCQQPAQPMHPQEKGGVANIFRQSDNCFKQCQKYIIANIYIYRSSHLRRCSKGLNCNFCKVTKYSYVKKIQTKTYLTTKICMPGSINHVQLIFVPGNGCNLYINDRI